MNQDSARAWPNDVRVAVSLTYDGALPEHLDVVGPTLDHLRLTGTFFLNPTRTLENVQGWQSMSDAGHEMANGCLLGVSEEGRLTNWTHRMVEQDLHMTQEFFENVFGEPPVSFAYPGRFTNCSQGSYRPIVNAAFPYSRSAIPGDNRAGANRRYLRVRDVAGRSQEELETWREALLAELAKTTSEKVWYVLQFGKIFDGETNRALILHELCATFLATQSESVWVAPLKTVADRFGVGSHLSISR